MTMELVVASSSGDSGISCWELQTGVQQLRHGSCSSTPHGLTCVGHRFLASSQLRDSNANAGSIFYWSWDKAQPEVKSFPAEPIVPLIANSDGTYIIGGGVSGQIYVWEVASGKLLQKWRAHIRGVTCLVLSKDDSLLISGSEDGSVRVWSLIMIFDDTWRQEAARLYLHDLKGHGLRVTDVVIGYGGCNALIVSASEDGTCKVWSLSTGTLLRSVLLPSVINAIALDPGDRVFYAGGRDGKIYIAALHVESSSDSTGRMHIIGTLPDQRNAVTCLAYSMVGDLLISGSEDGMIRVWDPRAGNVIRMFKHAPGQVNNLLVVRKETSFEHQRRSVNIPKGQKLAPPLEKYTSSTDDDQDNTTIVHLQGTYSDLQDVSYITSDVFDKQIKELQQQTSDGAAQLEVERSKDDCKKTIQFSRKLKQLNDNLFQFCVEELLEGKGTEKKKI